VKWPEREAVHSPEISDEVKKTWIYTSTFPYAFMAQGQFYVTLETGHTNYARFVFVASINDYCVLFTK
jgi:hypothetical protein